MLWTKNILSGQMDEAIDFQLQKKNLRRAKENQFRRTV